jgi:hypothetical protein
VLRKIEQYFNFYDYDRIFQFDSWRFWESMVSGCVTLHVDFEKYGVVLPIMPENEVHYIGIDLSNFEDACRKLKSVEKFEAISCNSQRWVLENYSPKAVAKRLLSLL